MTGIREHPPPSTAPAAPAMAATRPGRVVGLDGIRGLAALFVVLNHDRPWSSAEMVALRRPWEVARV
jgi:peptidoglycan/LPS O-acetylase OafA/YrhL